MNGRFFATLAQVIAWIGFLLLPLLFLKIDHLKGGYDLRSIEFVASVMIGNIVLIGIFYLNYHILLPKVLNKMGGLYFLGAVLACIVVLYFVRTISDETIHAMLGLEEKFFKDGGRRNAQFIFGVTFPTLMVIGLGTSIRLYADRQKTEKEIKEKQTEQLVSELSFLRSQISPHFMFNVLNSLVSLARKKSDKMETVILQLSNLLRYMLYYSDKDRVTVEKEIEYLQSYIDLQKLRFGDSVEINFTIEQIVPGFPIEPMLLIPFVENAFKHGIGHFEKPYIGIHLSTDSSGITFSVKNKYNDAVAEEKDESSGIGHINVKRRLDLLYGDRYKLDISRTKPTDKESWFIVELKLQLQ